MKDSPITKAVKKVLPAVVSITASKQFQTIEIPISLFGFEKCSSKGFGKKKVKIGGGSGFLVDPEGIILTNRHVIEDETAQYLVVLQNGERFVPEILAKDPINDVAILKIQKKGLPFVELGDSSTLELGETVIAIGNALGLFQNTVSVGVVSGLSREISAQSEFTFERTHLRGLIQTDAAINPGNSGGPLIDIEGKAVGINAAMVFGAENIGFALPINNAKKDLQEIKKYGRVRQPFLGVRYILLNKALQEQFNLPIDFGALVISQPTIFQGTKEAVVKGSPADKAGIKEGDIILEINQIKVTPQSSISEILNQCEIGQEISLKILRKNKEKIVKTILGEKK